MSGVRISAEEQHLEFRDLEGGGALVFGSGPEAEASLREALVAKPESPSIVGEQLDGGSLAVSEDKDSA